MFKKLFLTSFLLFTLFSVIYPTKKENTKIFDYCHSLENILSRNSIQKKKNVSKKVKSISKDIVKLWVDKTNGSLINKMIDEYKASRNSLIINFFPNEIYCFAGYWIENLKPGTIEAIFYVKSKKTINELNDLKDDVNGFLNDIDTEYELIKKEFNSFF